MNATVFTTMDGATVELKPLRSTAMLTVCRPEEAADAYLNLRQMEELRNELDAMIAAIRWRGEA